MALTDTDRLAMIEALERALGSGALTVQFTDRSVTYRSMDELLKALQYLKNQLTSVGQRYSFGVVERA